MPNALIADDDPDSTVPLADILRGRGFDVEMSQDIEGTRRSLVKNLPEVAILNETLHGSSVLDMLDELNVSSVTEIYLTSSHPSLETASKAMRLGVSDYFGKPVDTDRLARSIDELQVDLDRDPDSPPVKRTGRGLIIGESVPMRRLFRRVRKVAPTDASVLIIGESGVGKELVAATIHELSNRARSEMVAVNCGAIPKDLIESELFGHRKGSFTGATADHHGFFQLADGGTLLLDEITEMDVMLQAKLLRVLETNAFRPVGGEKEVAVDVRVVATTNQEPDVAINDGRLREDLYYRLTQFPIRVPRLSERGDDIVVLARHFVEQQNREQGITKYLSDEALDAIRKRDWPGNVRELKNAIIQAHLLAGDTIEAGDLPESMLSGSPAGGEYLRIGVGTPVAEVERQHILSTLEHFEGDKKRAAETLGISLKTLYNRLKEYGE